MLLMSYPITISEQRSATRVTDGYVRGSQPVNDRSIATKAWHMACVPTFGGYLARGADAHARNRRRLFSRQRSTGRATLLLRRPVQHA